MEYILHLCIFYCIYLLLSQSYNICFGKAGLFNIAHASSYALGAYSTAIISTEYHLHYAYGILLGMLLGGLFGVILFFIALRLQTDYFAICTLALAGIVSSFLMNWRELTRGVLGIPGIDRPVVVQKTIESNFEFLIFSSVITLIALVLMTPFFKGPLSRILIAQSEFIQGLSSLSYPVKRLQSLSLIVASIFAALAGSIFAHYMSYIDPSSFSLHEMIFILSIVILGAPGSYLGCIFACAFLLLLPEALRFLDLPSAYLGQTRQLLYGFIIFVVVYYKREFLIPRRRSV